MKTFDTSNEAQDYAEKHYDKWQIIQDRGTDYGCFYYIKGVRSNKKKYIITEEQLVTLHKRAYDGTADMECEYNTHLERYKDTLRQYKEQEDQKGVEQCKEGETTCLEFLEAYLTEKDAIISKPKHHQESYQLKRIADTIEDINGFEKEIHKLNKRIDEVRSLFFMTQEEKVEYANKILNK